MDNEAFNAETEVAATQGDTGASIYGQSHGQLLAMTYNVRERLNQKETFNNNIGWFVGNRYLLTLCNCSLS